MMSRLCCLVPESKQLPRAKTREPKMAGRDINKKVSLCYGLCGPLGWRLSIVDGSAVLRWYWPGSGRFVGFRCALVRPDLETLLALVWRTAARVVWSFAAWGWREKGEAPVASWVQPFSFMPCLGLMVASNLIIKHRHWDTGILGCAATRALASGR